MRFRRAFLPSMVALVTYLVAVRIIGSDTPNEPETAGAPIAIDETKTLKGTADSFANATSLIRIPGGNGSEKEVLVIKPPPFSPDVFPCSDCHEPDDEVVTERYEDLYHDDIKLTHDPDNIWCFSCHTPGNRDALHLSNGKPVPFTESYRLCGQCHGTQLRDWKAGDHGKRTGSWSGEKTYLLCAHCHSPHSPHFKAMKPLPPPIRQELVK